MQKIPYYFVCFFLLTFILPTYATSSFVLKTGDKTGTYYQIGADIKKLAKKYNIIINLVTSNGSLENILTLANKETIYLGLVQADVLMNFQDMNKTGELIYQIDDLSSEKIYDIHKATQALQVLLPLHREEVHLLTNNRHILNIKDLTGKKVVIGESLSGTFTTVSNLLTHFDIHPEKIWLEGGKDALKLLRTHKVDAVFFVGGAPIQLLKEKVGKKKLYLIPIIDNDIAKSSQNQYDMINIDKKHYEWQKKSVKTIGVTSYLMINAKGRSPHQCKYLKKLVKIMSKNLKWLQKKGHPTWKRVKFSTPIPDVLNKFSCVEEN